MNQLDLKGRTAVVTGGLIGIGAAIVKRLEASGAKVRGPCWSPSIRTRERRG